MEESPPPSPTHTSSTSQDNDNDFSDGPEMYDPSLYENEIEEDLVNSNFLEDEEDNTREGTDNHHDNNDNDSTEEDEDDYYTRGRSRSRSVHCNDDNNDGKPKGLSDAELLVQIEQAAKKHEKDSSKPVVVRTGALKQREVQALQMVSGGMV